MCASRFLCTLGFFQKTHSLNVSLFAFFSYWKFMWPILCFVMACICSIISSPSKITKEENLQFATIAKNLQLLGLICMHGMPCLLCTVLLDRILLQSHLSQVACVVMHVMNLTRCHFSILMGECVQISFCKWSIASRKVWLSWKKYFNGTSKQVKMINFPIRYKWWIFETCLQFSFGKLGNSYSSQCLGNIIANFVYILQL